MRYRGAYNYPANYASYYPYGEDKATPAPNDQIKFATYTRDLASGLDYADQRYYSNQFGRFMTPDPYMATAKGANDPSSPHSWNRYTYVVGDPVNLADPRGLYISAPLPGDGSGCFVEGEYDASLSCDQASDSCAVDDGSSLVPIPNAACYAGILLFAPPAKPPAPYLAGLELVGDCYDRSAAAFGLAGGAALDDLTYEPLNQYGTPYLGPVTISEQNTVTQGKAISINTSWTVSNGGTFTDYISSGPQQAVFAEQQSFVAVGGSGMPLTINWFYSERFAVLGVYATPSAVVINNSVPVNRDGSPHYCDQPASIQNR